MAVFSLSAWDLLGLKLTSLADLLWRRISAQCDSAANVLVRVQRSFQIKKEQKILQCCADELQCKNECFHEVTQLRCMLMKIKNKQTTAAMIMQKSQIELDLSTACVLFAKSTI